MGLKVLSALDTAKTQYYHFKAIIIAGMGLFSDAYDLFCIPPVTILLGYVYYYNPEDVPPVVVSAMVAVPLLGTTFGKLVFGFLGDKVGRRKVYGFALAIMVLSSFGCGFSICKSRTCVLLSLGFFRFFLGVGIGGDYPLSATIMSEFANKQTRGAFIAAVFSMQGFGILFSSMVTMTVCSIFNRATTSGYKDHQVHVMEVDLAWRIILMLGAVPAAITFYWRMKMPETARYTALVEHNVVQAAKDMEKVMDVNLNQLMENASSLPTSAHRPSTYPLFSKQFRNHHGQDLFSCAATWFLVDVVFYSSNLFQSHIYKPFLPNKPNAFEHAYQVAKLQAIIAICSTIPGYWFTVYFIDRIGRRKIQMFGFSLTAAVFLCIGVPYNAYWKDCKIGFMILYGITFFSSNFGPNTTAFIVPAELFPARFRTTCHGICGAAGKFGAIIGSIAFFWASPDRKTKKLPKGIGMAGSLIILGVISLIGTLVTYFFTPETKGRSLEENERTSSMDENHEANVLVQPQRFNVSSPQVHAPDQAVLDA